MPDLLTRLQHADPARGRELPEAARTALLDRIAAAPAPAPAPARRRIGPRRTLVLATVLALVLSGVGVATFDFGQTPEQVERDYAKAIRSVPLPPGYDWPGAMLDEDSHYTGRRAAIMQATGQAGCAWWDYWHKAAARADTPTMARALAGQARVFALTPRTPLNGSEDVGGIDATTVAYHRLLVADARAGRTARIRSYTEINC